MHSGFSGGGAANVSPAVPHSIGHACTVMYTGGTFESNIGEGKSDADSSLTNFSVDGSMA